MEEAEELKQKMKEYAEGKDFQINPDDKIVDWVIDGLLKNKKKHGEIYCPCRVVTGDKEKDKDIVCQCIDHLGELKDMGHCKCGLFVGK